MHADSRPWSIKLLVVALTAGSLVALPAVPALLVHAGLPDQWDPEHSILEALWPPQVATLLQHGLGLSRAQLDSCLLATALGFGALLACDILGGTWPRCWETHDKQCYLDMFCEPIRTGRLVACPGNTYSNAVFFFGGLAILSSALGGACRWRVPDSMFGGMMVILAWTSVLWHASNSKYSHYPDLWAMNACIVYLIVRFLFIGIDYGILLHLPGSYDAVMPAACAVVYLTLLVAGAKEQFANAKTRVFDQMFVLSGRARLVNNDMDIFKACQFAAMPVVFMLLPTLLQAIMGVSGSKTAATMASTCLVVGWSVRMAERFVLDGWGPMRWAHQLCAPKHSARDRRSNFLDRAFLKSRCVLVPTLLDAA